MSGGVWPGMASSVRRVTKSKRYRARPYFWYLQHLWRRISAIYALRALESGFSRAQQPCFGVLTRYQLCSLVNYSHEAWFLRVLL